MTFFIKSESSDAKVNGLLNSASDESKFSLINPQKIKSNDPFFNGWYSAVLIESISRGGVDELIPIFARTLGANTSQIGWISGVFSLVNIIQFFWANLSIKIGKSKIFVVLGWLLSVILYIPISFLRAGQILLLLIIRFLQGFLYSASAPAHTTLMGELIPAKERANKVGKITWLGLGGAFIGTIFTGFIISFLTDYFIVKTELAFVIIFFWTVLLNIIASIIFFVSVPDLRPIRIIDPEKIIQQELSVYSSHSTLTTFQKVSRYQKKFSNFWHFCIFASIFYFAVSLTGPFFIILKIEVYKLSFLISSIFTGLTTIIQVITSILITKWNILDRIGRKFPLLFGVVTISLGTFFTVLPYYINLPLIEGLIIAWSVLGLGWGVFNASLSVFLLDIIHPQYRMALVAAYNAFTGLSMFIGPILGGILIDSIFSIPFVFILRGVLITITFFLIVTIKEPEIPGAITHPFKYLFIKYFRFGADRGSEISIPPIRSHKVPVRSWHFLPKKFKQKE